MKNTALRLPIVTVRDPYPGTSVRVAECALTRTVVATSRWRDLATLLQLDLLAHPAAYLLVGRDLATGQACLRVGGAHELPARLYDPRWDERLRPADEVFVLTTDTPALTQADVLYWRKRLAAQAWAAGQMRVVRGGMRAEIPLHPVRRELLDGLLAHGCALLRAAGCPWLEPHRPELRPAA